MYLFYGYQCFAGTMCVLVPGEIKIEHKTLQLGLQHGCEPPCGYRQPNLGPLQKPWVFLATKPSPQLRIENLLVRLAVVVRDFNLSTLEAVWEFKVSLVCSEFQASCYCIVRSRLKQKETLNAQILVSHSRAIKPVSREEEPTNIFWRLPTQFQCWAKFENRSFPVVTMYINQWRLYKCKSWLSRSRGGARDATLWPSFQIGIFCTWTDHTVNKIGCRWLRKQT